MSSKKRDGTAEAAAPSAKRHHGDENTSATATDPATASTEPLDASVAHASCGEMSPEGIITRYSQWLRDANSLEMRTPVFRLADLPFSEGSNFPPLDVLYNRAVHKLGQSPNTMHRYGNEYIFVCLSTRFLLTCQGPEIFCRITKKSHLWRRSSPF
jgi:hypothetical protein